MHLDNLKLMISSIVRRLVHLAIFDRMDIELFAPLVAEILADPPKAGALEVPSDYRKWLARVKRQLALEKHLPAGCRLGTFEHSPVLFLEHYFAPRTVAVKSPWHQKWLEAHYRASTGLDRSIDAVMEKQAGYSVKSYAAALISNFKADPTLAYLLLSREIALAAKYGALEASKPDFTKVSQFGALYKDNTYKIVCFGAAMFAHECVWKIARKLRIFVELDPMGKSTSAPQRSGAQESRSQTEEGARQGSELWTDPCNDRLQRSRSSGDGQTGQQGQGTTARQRAPRVGRSRGHWRQNG